MEVATHADVMDLARLVIGATFIVLIVIIGCSITITKAIEQLKKDQP